MYDCEKVSLLSRAHTHTAGGIGHMRSMFGVHYVDCITLSSPNVDRPSVALIILVPLLPDDGLDVVGVLARSGVVDADDIDVRLLLLDECIDDIIRSLLKLLIAPPTCWLFGWMFLSELGECTKLTS